MSNQVKETHLPNLTKLEIVLEIYEKTGFLRKNIVKTVQMTLDIVQEALADGRNAEFRNFGVLEVTQPKAVNGRKTKRPSLDVISTAHAEVTFKEGKILKQKLTKIRPCETVTRSQPA